MERDVSICVNITDLYFPGQLFPFKAEDKCVMSGKEENSRQGSNSPSVNNSGDAASGMLHYDVGIISSRKTESPNLHCLSLCVVFISWLSDRKVLPSQNSSISCSVCTSVYNETTHNQAQAIYKMEKPQSTAANMIRGPETLIYEGRLKEESMHSLCGQQQMR